MVLKSDQFSRHWKRGRNYETCNGVDVLGLALRGRGLDWISNRAAVRHGMLPFGRRIRISCYGCRTPARAGRLWATWWFSRTTAEPAGELNSADSILSTGTCATMKWSCDYHTNSTETLISETFQTWRVRIASANWSRDRVRIGVADASDQARCYTTEKIFGIR